MIRKLVLIAVLLVFTTSAFAIGPLRKRMQEHLAAQGTQYTQLAGLDVAYWLPDAAVYPAPLVIFSHGLGGCKTQSTFLTSAMAAHGYIVVAPDHRDASCNKKRSPSTNKPPGIAQFEKWNDQTYKDRGEDIKNLYDALKNDPAWSKRIDWDKVALSGHSMGGYTTFALAGAWTSWKMSGIKAILGLSPYVGPLLPHGDFSNIDVPVMYQSGTRDAGILPSIVRSGGAFEKTPSPAWFVEFKRTGHFGFTDLQKGSQQLIVDYSLWFLDHTLKGGSAPFPQEEGVEAQREK